MKLLPRQKVQSLVEDQRRIQIDEGITLARKIDALREKLADLQQQHDLFVMGMEDNLKDKTQKLFEIIQEKETEIKLLEVKRQALLEPLDIAWQQVNAGEQDNIKAQDNLAVLFQQYKDKEERIDGREKESKEKLQHIKVRERELERTFDKAEQLRIETEKGYIQMSTEKEEHDKLFNKLLAALQLREKTNTSFQFTLQMREEQIELKEKELEKMRLQLIDQRETLKRAINRLKK